MNTNSLKRFATVARNLLMQGVRNRLKAVGFNDDGSVRVEPVATGNSAIFDGQVINDSRFVARWNALRDRIASHGVKEVVEEAAYTWFNRLMAIRILEYNSLAPALLDYENPEIRIPRIVTDARAGKTPVLSDEDRASLEAVIGDGRLSFEQFSLLIRAYCENNPIIRKCFGGITDYTALLLPTDILTEDGFIDLLNKAGEFIEPDDYRKPELIGWLYQFYIAEKKDEVFAKKGGYDSDEIPAATQIFTPNWIVKYMVENTLGRIYLDNNPDSTISENWKYLVTPAEPTPDEAILRYDSLEDLKCGDLSCGSGHILNEMFDLLYALYAEDFYSPREAIEAILTKNMVGIDIDDRARQLAQFALLLKACQTDTAFADGHCMPRIYSMPDKYNGTEELLRKDIRDFFGGCDPDVENELVNSILLFEQADILGSIMKFPMGNDTFSMIVDMMSFPTTDWSTPYAQRLLPFFNIICALQHKYDVLVSNPPYMPTSRNAELAKYAKEYYPDTKADMFAIFIEMMLRQVREHGRVGIITMESWMFLSSFEKMRRTILDNYFISSLTHFGWHIIGIAFGTAMTIFEKSNPGKRRGQYSYLTIEDVDRDKNIPFQFPKKDNGRFAIANQKEFEQIPGAPVAYYASNQVRKCYNSPKIELVADTRLGMATADNDRFLRFFWEVNNAKVCFTRQSTDGFFPQKWFPYAKGGSLRKWAGNMEYVVNWENNGEAIMNFTDDKGKVRSHNYNLPYIFKRGITWNALSSGRTGFRVLEYALFDNAGSSLFAKDSRNYSTLMALLNSSVFPLLMSALSETFNYQPGNIASIPFISPDSFSSQLDNIVTDCISISKQDWDAHETSWDFETSPLLAVDSQTYRDNIDWMIECHRCKTGEQICIDPAAPELGSLQWRYDQYCQKWECLFDRLHHNEEELNRKFIDIYGLQDELTPDVALEDVTILQQGEIKIVDEAAIELETGGVLSTESGETLTVGIAPQIEWQRDVVIKQFISYAVGCMMGRYRLDRPGLAIAHPNPSADEFAPYVVPQTGEQWWIDDDGIVPMMGEDSPFHDNAANRFTEFVRVAFGNEYLTENMNFVRDALGKDVVDYFRSDFYNDHKKMYQNRPIYWMFSSNQKGKRAAFQCLVYMHRMNRFTPEHIRTNYLLPYIDHIAAREAELSARSSLSAKENKLLKQLRSDLEECRDYQLRLHEFADRQIEIDLDDGVVKNYATFAPVLAKLK